MREKRWLLLCLYGILLANAVTGALKATRPKFKIATTSTTTTSTTTEESRAEEDGNEDVESTTVATEGNATNGHTLTGIPQIDYIWDPNLPRELNGYNLSDYPFYNSIPEDIDFKCDGLHDGFYASVPHKCQVYHHCLFGTRYDFLCANFTAFDQKTFICHFVSEVDCANSKKYWHRNDALYKAATTSTSTTTTTTTTAPPVTASSGRAAPRDREPSRRRRPMRRRPAYEYYDEDYYDDEYTRPRGYDRRDDYEYDDRKYRRDRDRDFRDRDFRDRDPPRSRDPSIVRDDRDREISTTRERFPARGNRRDPSPARSRDPEQGGSRSREIDDPELDDRRTDFRVRDGDDRRYSEKRFRDEYDDKDTAVTPAVPISADGLVKPAAPTTSVYARPRTPPKIRRPVPLSEQDRYAYKATPVQSTEEPRRRPIDVPEDDYYEDDLEEVRPIRRPLRRRPTYRERDRDRDFYDVRDRERDRPFRSRYRDDEDDVRPRKHLDRSRDRYYDRERERGSERGRDRSLDRGKDRTPSLDRDHGRVVAQEAERSERPYSSRVVDRERDVDRPRSSSRSKEVSDPTEAQKRPNAHDRTGERTTSTGTGTTSSTSATTTSATTSATTTTCLPESLIRGQAQLDAKKDQTDRFERPERPYRPLQAHGNERPSIEDEEIRSDSLEKSHKQTQHVDYQQERDQVEGNDQQQQYHHQPQHYHQVSSSEEYSSEYYDEPEDPPIPPPRTAVRIVKRPFLPSRGGNPNPRGLSSVGSKAPTSSRKDEIKPTERVQPVQLEHNGYYVQETHQEAPDSTHERKQKPEDVRHSYDAYKVIQSDLQQKQRQDDYDTTVSRPVSRRPTDRGNPREEESSKSTLEAASIRAATNERQQDIGKIRESEASIDSNKWSTDLFFSEKQTTDSVPQTSLGTSTRNKNRLPPTETTNVYSATYKNDEAHDQPPSAPGNLRAKQRINEVTHRLQDIPESEYDVTLNDALTPTLNQETNLPSGFVLPLHRQLGRDAILQPSENNYKISRPIGQQQPQPQQQQQQKPFVPSPQFLPQPAPLNDRQRTVYYRTPESIQISGTQYRQQRGPWQDYAGY